MLSMKKKNVTLKCHKLMMDGIRNIYLNDTLVPYISGHFPWVGNSIFLLDVRNKIQTLNGILDMSKVTTYSYQKLVK